MGKDCILTNGDAVKLHSVKSLLDAWCKFPNNYADDHKQNYERRKETI